MAFVLTLMLVVMIRHVSAAVTITSPLTGDQYLVGETVAIEWSSSDSEVDVFLSYSIDNGENWITIATLEDTGSYTWTIPDLETTHAARIRVARLSQPPELASTGTFSILRHSDPSDFAALPQSSSEIRLTWTDNSDIEQTFLLLRQSFGGAYEVLAILPANSEEYYDYNLQPDTLYVYRIQALNDHWGNSGSAETFAMTLSPPRESEGKVIIQLYIDNTEYYVNGVLKSMDTPPIIRESRTLLPVRYVAEPLGASVTWDPEERKVTITLGSRSVELWIGQNQARVNWTYQYIDPLNHKVTPIIVDPGRTLIPVRFIAEVLGCEVFWNDTIRQVTIDYPAPSR